MSDYDKVTILHKRGLKAADLRSKQAVNQAMRNGTPIDTSKKFNAATNKKAPSAPQNAAKLDNETEDFHINHVSMDVSRLIQQQRQKLGITQKDLSTKICEKPQVIVACLFDVYLCFPITLGDQRVRGRPSHTKSADFG